MHISDSIIVALIAAVPGIITALIMGFRNHEAIKDVHVAINSRLTELILASIDKGRIQEQDIQAAAIAKQNTGV